MARTVEQKAQRFVNATHKHLPKIVKHHNAFVGRIDRLTDYDNDHPDDRNEITRAYLTLGILGSIAMRAPVASISLGRLFVRQRSFRSALREAQPEAVESIRREETDYYTVATNILGIDADEALEGAFTESGIQSVDE